MKLSKIARDHVAHQVTDGFAKELAELDVEIEKAEKHVEDIYKAFEKDVRKISDEAMVKVRKLIAKYGFTWEGNHYDPDKAHLELHGNESCYSELCESTFDQTNDDRDATVIALRMRKCALEKLVKTSVEKALYEVEVHGRKETLDDIVNRVIAEAKNNRNNEKGTK